MPQKGKLRSRTDHGPSGGQIIRSETTPGRLVFPLMIQDEAESPANPEGARLAERREDLVWWATWAGLILCFIGFVDGLMMALKKRVADCTDGTYFPEGTTDFDCYVHPQAGVGIGIAVLSVVLGILVVFSSIAVRASLRERPKSP
jgi:hypothetical protein